MYSKYYALVLAISILLLAYALHSSPKSSFHNVSALLTDPYVARAAILKDTVHVTLL
ncbi:hypothetical protein MUO83_08695 [Candidatus Bathyarchaeota archaeon]|nr:hypothetical protein [Candidatus Bathyarchaeota archaeon]